MQAAKGFSCHGSGAIAPSGLTAGTPKELLAAPVRAKRGSWQYHWKGHARGLSYWIKQAADDGGGL